MSRNFPLLYFFPYLKNGSLINIVFEDQLGGREESGAGAN